MRSTFPENRWSEVDLLACLCSALRFSKMSYHCLLLHGAPNFIEGDIDAPFIEICVEQIDSYGDLGFY